MKYIEKFRNFMYGRYGIDDLYKFLFKVYLILIIIDLFVKSKILLIIELLLIILIFYRMFSKKIYQRNNENELFLKIKGKITKPFKKIVKRVKDKNHIYRKCHKCKTIIRLPLPKKIGVKTVKCPECGKKRKVLVLKKKKSN